MVGTHLTLPVSSGQWRTYRFPIPASLAGQQRLELGLNAPIFIPAHVTPDSVDTRPLSLMINAVQIET
ncbi:MAG: hypothetical protein HC837_04205 [Chloroflexaceae bacterium]|nr:hypothetical protein [Chloroflexaceae bacterium]